VEVIVSLNYNLGQQLKQEHKTNHERSAVNEPKFPSLLLSCCFNLTLVVAAADTGMNVNEFKLTVWHSKIYV